MNTNPGLPMHTDLSPHLHTEECNNLIQLLVKCHTDYPYRKFFGHCNELDTQMVKCLKKERLDKMEANKEKAKARREQIRTTKVDKSFLKD